MLFGSGYVLLAFLRSEFVGPFDRLAAPRRRSQVTPGPVFTTATFVGYVLAGAPGPLLDTVGILFCGLLSSSPLPARSSPARETPRFWRGCSTGKRAFLALIVGVTCQLGRRRAGPGAARL